MQLIKNRHEEVEENSFKNNIYQFHGKKQKNRLQKSSDVTPIRLLSNFMWWSVLRILIGLGQKCKQKRWLVENEIPPCSYQ